MSLHIIYAAIPAVVFGGILREGARQGVFRKCDVEHAAWQFFGMLSAYILYEPLMGAGRRHRPYSRRYVRRVVEGALDLFLNGVRVRKRAGGGKKRGRL